MVRLLTNKTKVVKIQRRKTFKKESYGDDWDQLEKACKKRDNYTCRECGYDQKKYKYGHKKFRMLHASHIIAISKGGRNILANLKTKCVKCHENETNTFRPKNMKVNWTGKR